jgi:putative addiction module killer protein
VNKIELRGIVLLFFGGLPCPGIICIPAVAFSTQKLVTPESHKLTTRSTGKNTEDKALLVVADWLKMTFRPAGNTGPARSMSPWGPVLISENPLDNLSYMQYNITISLGSLGEIRSIEGGLFEAKIRHGFGFRLYFVNKGTKTIVLLCGGDKSTQKQDIKRAREMAKEI